MDGDDVNQPAQETTQQQTAAGVVEMLVADATPQSHEMDDFSSQQESANPEELQLQEYAETSVFQ
jgi:hypothetical protein